MRAPFDAGARLRQSLPARVRVAMALTLCVAAIVFTRGTALWNTPAPVRAVPSRVRLASGSAGVNPLGDALAEAYRRVLPGVDIVAQASAGSVETIEALQHGDADIGPALANVAYLGYVGHLPKTTRPLDRLRAIALLQMNPLHIVLAPGLHARSIHDLRGRRVGIGPAGSGTALTSQILLQGYGLSLADLVVHQMSFSESALRLVAGTLDAFIALGPYPVEAITMAVRHGATLLPVTGSAVEHLRAQYPFVQVTFVPADTYPGQVEPIRTIGIGHVLLCRADLDEGMVYTLTRSLFQVLPSLSSQQAVLRLIDADRAPATPIPLHAGAERYYRERELMR